MYRNPRPREFRGSPCTSQSYMSIKKMLLGVAAMALPLLAACSDLTQTSAAKAETAQPTSVLNAATGEITSIKPMTKADREFVVPSRMSGKGLNAVVLPPEICDPSVEYCVEEPCDPRYQYGCYPCDPTDPEHWCYEPPCYTPTTIGSVATVRTGDDPNAGLEASGTAYYNCGGYLMLVGVGIRQNADDNITTLHLKYRRVNADGTLGATELRKYGSEPNHSLEAEGEVTEGNAIVGIGIGNGNSHNVRTLRIYRRPIGMTSAGVRTYGNIDFDNFGYVPGGVLDTQYTIPLANTNQVYVGLGARAHWYEVKTLAHFIGTLN